MGGGGVDGRRGEVRLKITRKQRQGNASELETRMNK